MTNNTTSSEHKIAVIILNWNGAALLQQFLPSVIANTPSTLGRVIVADNGSTDDSLHILNNEFPEVEVLQFEQNYGFAEGYNRAIKHYSNDYEYAVLLNSDIAVKEDWLTPLYQFISSHKEIAACQPKIMSYRHPEYFEYAGAAGGYIDRYGYPYCRGRIFSSVERDEGQYDTISTDLFWATGATLMVRTKTYLDAGGLDADFFAHMEEIDLCWRIQLLGYKIAVVPQSRVFHLGGGSLDMKNPRKTYLNFRNNLLMLHKNLPDNTRKRTLFIRRMLDTIAWSKFIATFDWANAKSIWKAHRDFARMRKAYTQHPSIDLLHTSPTRPNILFDYYFKRHTKYSQL